MLVGGPRAGARLSLQVTQGWHTVCGHQPAHQMHPRVHGLPSRPCWSFTCVGIQREKVLTQV